MRCHSELRIESASVTQREPVAVVRADNCFAFRGEIRSDDPLAERTAAMRAYVVEREELSTAGAKHGDRYSVVHKTASLPERNLINRSHVQHPRLRCLRGFAL